MNTALVAAIISAATAALVAVGTYLFNRRRDRDLEWRKLKLERYQEYLAALSGIVGRRSTSENQARYADAFNSLALVAPARVIRLLQQFHNEQRSSNADRSVEAYETLQDRLLREMRGDIHPAITDPRLSFYLIDSEPAPERILSTTTSSVMAKLSVELVDAAAHLENLVEQVAAGANVLITRDGRPFARLVAIAQPGGRERVSGTAKGIFTVPEDFDSPLDEFRDPV